MKGVVYIWVSLLGAALLALFGGQLFVSATVAAGSIAVNSFADDMTDNGNCTLREAVEAANTNTAVDACPAGSATNQDIITLPTGTYYLTIGSAGENKNQGGDLDILESVKIEGEGVTIDASGIISDRVFDVGPAADFSFASFYDEPESEGGRTVGATADTGIKQSLDVSLSGMTLTHGSALYGGAVMMHTGRMQLDDTVFASNDCGYGCGLFVLHGTVLISDTILLLS